MPAISIVNQSAWPGRILIVSFFVSGACALIYQLCWLRFLNAAIGVDLDSSTIVVSAFMLGIGIGGFFGGRLADLWPKARIACYATAELLLAAYGFSSLELFAWAAQPGHLLGVAHHGLNAAGGFLMLLFPTALMGATLPLLTLSLNRTLRNIGGSVGILYASNTLGAATAVLLTTFVFFDYLGLRSMTQVAAIGNVFVALTALALHQQERKAT